MLEGTKLLDKPSAITFFILSEFSVNNFSILCKIPMYHIDYLCE